MHASKTRTKLVICRRGTLLATFATMATLALSAFAQNTSYPKLHTNQEYLEEVARATKLTTSDPLAVFAFVLESLPDSVKVYPTGNYYYFRFIHNGAPYAGNIRLDALNRDSGKVHFAYYQDLAPWAGDETDPVMKVVRVVFDTSNGVVVEKLERLVYRVALGGKSVVFVLNDLSQVRPPASVLAPDEKFVGPIFDESGLRFFLIFNSKLKAFHYILDETVSVTEEFVPSRKTDRIVIGRRTAFAFYRDMRLDRKILIGVFEGNRRANNYFDGPFDQRPDNFIEADQLRDLIYEVEPGLKGRIDRLGRSEDYTRSYAIVPYIHYRTEDDLYVIHKCVTSTLFPASFYYNCFVVERSPSEVRPVRRPSRRVVR